MHDINCSFRIKRFRNSIQIFLDRFSSSEIERGIDGDQEVRLIGGSNIRRILLRRPGGFPVIHLLVVFWSKWGRRNKRVSDEFVSVFESMTFLIEIDDSFCRLPKERGIIQIPVSGDKKNLLNGSGL